MCSGPQNTWVQEQISNAVHCHVSNSAHVWAERSNIIPPLCPMLPTGPPSIQYRQVSETVTAQVYAVSPTHTVNGIIPLGQRPEPYRRAFQTPGYGQPSYNNSINNRGLTSHPNNALAQGGLSRIIIAKNLSQKTTAAELKIYFSTAGAVDNVELKCNTGSNGDKCTATITFKQPEQASLAAKEFNGREFQGRRLMIQYKWEGSVKDDTEDLEGKLSELKVADEAAQSQTVSDGPVIANGSDEEINEGTSTFRKSK